MRDLVNVNLKCSLTAGTAYTEFTGTGTEREAIA
jgi:hypothetical protein